MTWDLAVAAVPPSVVAEPRLPGGRSVKDTVAHVAAWERWAEARIAARRQGRAPLAISDIAICYPENTASWRVMEKAGMTFDGEGDYYGIHMKRHVADRATWRRPSS